MLEPGYSYFQYSIMMVRFWRLRLEDHRFQATVDHVWRSHLKRNTRGWSDGSAALAALAEDRCQVFSTNSNTYNSSSRDRMPTSGLWGQLHSCVCVCATTLHVWRSEDNLQRLVFSFHCVGLISYLQSWQQHLTCYTVSLASYYTTYQFFESFMQCILIIFMPSLTFPRSTQLYVLMSWTCTVPVHTVADAELACALSLFCPENTLSLQ